MHENIPGRNRRRCEEKGELFWLQGGVWRKQSGRNKQSHQRAKRGLSKLSDLTFCPKAGSDLSKLSQQMFVQSLKASSDGLSPSFLGDPSKSCVVLSISKIFLVSDLDFCCCSWKLLTSCPFVIVQKELSSLSAGFVHRPQLQLGWVCLGLLCASGTNLYGADRHIWCSYGDFGACWMHLFSFWQLHR